MSLAAIHPSRLPLFHPQPVGPCSILELPPEVLTTIIEQTRNPTARRQSYLSDIPTAGTCNSASSRGLTDFVISAAVAETCKAMLAIALPLLYSRIYIHWGSGDQLSILAKSLIVRPELTAMVSELLYSHYCSDWNAHHAQRPAVKLILAAIKPIRCTMEEGGWLYWSCSAMAVKRERVQHLTLEHDGHTGKVSAESWLSTVQGCKAHLQSLCTAIVPAALPADCDLAALATLAIDTVPVSVWSFGLLHRLVAAAPNLEHFSIERLHSVRYGGDREWGSKADMDETIANIAKALAQRHLLSLRITELGDDRTGGFTADLMPPGLLLGAKVHQFYGHAHSIGTLSRPDSPLRRLTLAIQPTNYQGGEILHLLPSATEEVINLWKRSSRHFSKR